MREFEWDLVAIYHLIDIIYYVDYLRKSFIKENVVFKVKKTKLLDFVFRDNRLNHRPIFNAFCAVQIVWKYNIMYKKYPDSFWNFEKNFDNVWLDGITSFWKAVIWAAVQLNLETKLCLLTIATSND